jgi:hypothetical protein
MSPAKFLHYLVLTARPTGLLFIAALSLGFALCLAAGWFGVPMLVILLSWLFKYAYVLLEHVAHGAREPPVLAVEMLNPATELRPWIQLAIVMLFYMALRAVSGSIGTAATLLIEGLALVALPASIAALAVGDAYWQAVNPLALWQIMRALGLSYVAIVAVVLLYGYGLVALANYALSPVWLLDALSIFAWLSLFSLLGGGLFEERAALGHEAIHAPERAERRAQWHLERERAHFVDGVSAQVRNGNLAGAWQTTERELAALGHGFESYDWLLEHYSRLQDQRLAGRLAQDYITRALGRDNGRVIAILRARLAIDDQFHPRTAAETLRVATLARLAGDRASALCLLRAFSRHFADAPAAVQATARAEAEALAVGSRLP